MRLKISRKYLANFMKKDKNIFGVYESDVGSVVSMLATETMSFQGSWVQFPVKSLGFFRGVFQREKYQETGCFMSGFSPRVESRVFPCLLGAKPGRMRSSGREIEEGR